MSSVISLSIISLVSIACSMEAIKPIEVATLLRSEVRTAKTARQTTDSYEKPDGADAEFQAAGETSNGSKAKESIATNDTNAKKDNQNSLQLVRERVFQEYCTQAVPETGDRKVIQARALDLITSHIFPACLTYECRWVLKLPNKVCDAISEQAKILRKEAQKYKRHLYIQGLHKRAAEVLYILK